jgi:hypothetical protein
MSQSEGYLMDGYQNETAAAYAPADARVAFIRNTYAHLAGALLAFIAIEATLIVFAPQLGEALISTLFSSKIGILVVLGAFIGVNMLANYWANSETSVSMQYAGLGLYVVLEAIIFLPILYAAANFYPGQQMIPKAAIATTAIFLALTTIVFTTKADFSFMSGVLCVLGWSALGIVVASIIFGFSLGIVFWFAMVGLAAGYLLYDTSNVLHHYRTTQHVAAALALFSSVAMLFYYILRIFMSSGRSD